MIAGKGVERRILHVVLSLSPGGTERLVIQMAKHAQRSAQVAVCCVDEPGDWAHELIDHDIPVKALHRAPGFRPALALKISQLVRRQGANLLHCHHYSPFIYGALAALVTPGVKVVYTEHGRYSDALPSPKRKLANGFFARTPGSFVAVSDDLRHHMIAEGFSPHRVHVIHNGVVVGPHPTDAERLEARRRLGLDPAWVIFATVARLNPVKDLVTMINAFSQAGRDNPSLRLVIVGDGGERGKLETLAGSTEIGKHIIFTGQRDDVRELMPGFDVYVNSSIIEGISVTILEAMASGVAVLATRVGGTPEVVVENHTGVLVPARSPGELALAMKTLVDDRVTRMVFARNGRARVEQSFSMDRMLADYQQLYTDLLGE